MGGRHKNDILIIILKATALQITKDLFSVCDRLQQTLNKQFEAKVTMKVINCLFDTTPNLQPCAFKCAAVTANLLTKGYILVFLDLFIG